MIVNEAEFGPVDSPGSLSQLNVPGVVGVGGLSDYEILAPLANGDITGISGCIGTFVVSIVMIIIISTPEIYNV